MYTKVNSYYNQIFVLKKQEIYVQKLEKHLWVKLEQWVHEKKLWAITEKYTPFLSKIPGIQSICVCNSLAMNSCNENSDIDLFIITKKNRLWTARIFTTLLLTILRKRKTSKKHAGQFCLSFFISETDLSLEEISIENDIYLFYWLKTIVPIINKSNTFEDFIHSNQAWCDFKNKKTTNKIGKNSEQALWITHKLLTKCWDFCEKLFKLVFLPRTKKSFQKLWKPFWVVISDTMLKFHDQDKRKNIRDIISY